MRRAVVALALALAPALYGCPSEVGPVDPTAYASCNGRCVVAFDVPYDCDGPPPLDRAVAVAAVQRSTYQAAVGGAPCRYDDPFLDARFGPMCIDGTCTLTRDDTNTGVVCQRDEDCGAGYRCLDVEGYADPVCVAVEEVMCTPEPVATPSSPELPLPTTRPFEPVPVCDGDFAHLGPDFTCARVGSECAEDGWPTNLPVGAVFVDPTASGDGTRATPFGTLDEALASTAGVIALRTGDHVVTSIQRDVEIVGACARGVQLRGDLDVVRGTVALREVTTEGVMVRAAATVAIEDVTMTGGVEVHGAATILRSFSTGADARGVLVTGSASIERSEIRDATDEGLRVEAGQATLTGVWIGGTRSDEEDFAEVTITGTSAVTLRDVRVVGSSFGVVLLGGQVVAQRLAIVRGTQAILARLGAQLIAQTLDISGVDRGLLLLDGEIEIEDAVIRAVDRGIHVLAMTEPAVLRLRKSSIRAREEGIVAANELATVAVEDVELRGPMRAAFSVQFGDLQAVRVSVEDAEHGAFAYGGDTTFIDLTMTDVTRGIEVVEDGRLTVQRAHVQRVGVAGFIAALGAVAQLSDVEVVEGSGNADGEFGRAVAVESEAQMSVERARFIRTREVAATAQHPGSRLLLRDVLIAETLPRTCCAGAELGVGVGAYDGASAELTGFDISAPLACLQEGNGGQVTGSTGTLRDCIVGHYIDESPPLTDVCHVDVMARTNVAGIDVPIVSLP